MGNCQIESKFLQVISIPTLLTLLQNIYWTQALNCKRTTLTLTKTDNKTGRAGLLGFRISEKFKN